MLIFVQVPARSPVHQLLPDTFYIVNFATDMPIVLRIKGYRFFFFSNEGLEPKHIHIEKAEASGKLWLESSVEVEYFYGFTAREHKEIKKIVNDNLELLKNT